jgi:hypothetical protein
VAEKNGEEILHLFPNGQVEVGTGKPGYRWVNAYSQVTQTGFTNPVTRKSWQLQADRDGMKLKFHKSESDAREELTTTQQSRL